jgi:hypothetical protein
MHPPCFPHCLTDRESFSGSRMCLHGSDKRKRPWSGLSLRPGIPHRRPWVHRTDSTQIASLDDARREAMAWDPENQQGGEAHGHRKGKPLTQLTKWTSAKACMKPRQNDAGPRFCMELCHSQGLPDRSALQIEARVTRAPDAIPPAPHFRAALRPAVPASVPQSPPACAAGSRSAEEFPLPPAPVATPAEILSPRS